jgi:CO/xanthine dehydrogenase FAD-binding subunit
VSDYARPATLPQALRLLAEGGWRPLAGGTDLYPGAGSGLAGRVLDLADLAELAGISRDAEQNLRIGAAASWTEVIEADLPSACRALQQSARAVGGRQVQNAGTIGGNLCNASPAADGIPPLLVLDAEVELLSQAGLRRLALADFVIGPRRTALDAGEVLAAVILPASSLSGRSAFLKLGARSHLVISIAMVAARLDVVQGRVAKAALAIGACGPVARRLPEVEAALIGAPVDKAVALIDAGAVAAALDPIDDVRATAAYRREAAVELLRRAVAEALG